MNNHAQPLMQRQLLNIRALRRDCAILIVYICCMLPSPILTGSLTTGFRGRPAPCRVCLYRDTSEIPGHVGQRACVARPSLHRAPKCPHAAGRNLCGRLSQVRLRQINNQHTHRIPPDLSESLDRGEVDNSIMFSLKVILSLDSPPWMQRRVGFLGRVFTEC